MQEKNEFIKNGLYILKAINNDIKIEENCIVNKKNKTKIETKYDIKKYIRNIISSTNKNYSNDIETIIALRYILDKEKLETLNEIFPNLELFSSTYIRVMNEKIKIRLKSFDYESLLYSLVKEYVDYINKKLKKTTYLKNIEEEKNLTKEIEKLELELKNSQIVKKNRFYYETYLNSVEHEMEMFQNDKSVIDENINNLDLKIKEIKEEYKKISKKIMIKKQKKLDELQNEIDYLEKEKNKLYNEIEKLKKQNELNILKNNNSFEIYVKELTLLEFKKYYSELKDIDINKLLLNITDKKTKLNKVVEEISSSDYPENHLVLKHYALDNLKTIDKKSDLRPKVINEIIKILNENKS